MLALAAQCRLGDLVAEKRTLRAPGGVNATVKVPALAAGMVAGADSIANMDLLRHGGMLSSGDQENKVMLQPH